MQETLLKSRKPGFDAAEMVFDQGNKMVKMNCKKDQWMAAGRAVEGSRAREAAQSCPKDGDASGQEAASNRSLVLRFLGKRISLPSLARRL